MPSATHQRRTRSSHPLASVHSEDEDNVASSDASEAEESSDESSLDEEVVQTKQKTIVRADLTPYHRLEKRPQRRTAMRASERWSALKPGGYQNNGSSSSSSILDDVPFAVVIDNRSIEQKRDASKRQVKRPRNTSPVTITSADQNARTPNGKGKEREASIKATSTPKSHRSNSVQRANGKAITKTVSPSTTPNGRGRVKDIEAPVYTPSKKQKLPATPSRKPIPITPSKSSAPKLIGDVRISQSRDQRANDRLFVQPTSSDAYFANHAPRKRKGAAYQTSDNTISNLMAPIAAEAISDLSASIASQLKEKDPKSLLAADHYEQHYDYWWSMMVHLQRPLIFHGVGSKRAQLQSFAKHLAQKGFCSVGVVLGDSGGRIEDVLKEIELCVGKPPASAEHRKVYATTLEARAYHAVDAFEADSKLLAWKLPPYFLILIHNFDSATLLQRKSFRTLTILLKSARILLCVDVCHINSGLISSLHSDSEHDAIHWLWIGMNTFVPMLQEVVNERGSGISRTIGLPRVLDIRSAGGGEVDVLMMNGSMQATTSTATLLSAKAAIAILRSVTDKAQRLFLSLSAKLSDDGMASIKYIDLSTLARDSFVATTSEALRNLLVEFTSHGLIRLHEVEGEQMVSIALSQRDLNQVASHFTTAKS